MIRRLRHWILGLIAPFGRTRWSGKTALIGLTATNHAGEPIQQFQCWGEICFAHPKDGFDIVLQGYWAGNIYSLPPDPRRFELAPRGEYRLKTTGEVVEDPDFLTTWNIDPPADGAPFDGRTLPGMVRPL